MHPFGQWWSATQGRHGDQHSGCERVDKLLLAKRYLQQAARNSSARPLGCKHQIENVDIARKGNFFGESLEGLNIEFGLHSSPGNDRALQKQFGVQYGRAHGIVGSI